MRTSHLAIRRMIADARNRLTPERIFGSAQFAAFLTDIAEGATKRYRRKSRVATYWDDSEHAETAHTDNHTILVNTGNFLTRSFPTKDLMADSLIGITGHECGHILFSDFVMLDTYHQALSGGRFYPHEPEDLAPKQEKSLKEILDAFGENAGQSSVPSRILRTASSTSWRMSISRSGCAWHSPAPSRPASF